MSVTIESICQGLQAVENDALSVVDPAFSAGLWMPSREQFLALQYPTCFHLPIAGGPVNFATGEPGLDAVDLKKPLQRWRHVIRVPILVGQASNEMADLLDLVDELIPAFYHAVNGAFTLGQLVQDTRVGQYEIGEMKFRDTTHFGVAFPVYVYVRERMTVAP